MRKNPFFGTMFLSALMLFGAASCTKEAGRETVEEPLLPAAQKAGREAVVTEAGLLTSVRQATARYHSTTQAVRAGYEPDDHCVSVPGLGGMGAHWVNPELVDPVFDPLRPEAMLYVTGAGGKPRLIAVEYIVIDAGQPRPRFGDQLFDVGGTPVPVPHWSLHVWLYEHNPSGLYAPFNPNISCP